jgi:protein-tyrosine phosphatase
MIENIKAKFNNFLQKSVDKDTKQNLSFIDELDDDIILDDDKKIEPLEEQLKGSSSFKIQGLDKGIYYVTSFWKKLFILEYKNYKTGENLK